MVRGPERITTTLRGSSIELPPDLSQRVLHGLPVRVVAFEVSQERDGINGFAAKAEALVTLVGQGLELPASGHDPLAVRPVLDSKCTPSGVIQDGGGLVVTGLSQCRQ